MADVIIKVAIAAAAIMGYVNFAYLIIINDKLNEMKAELSRLKKEKEDKQ